MKGEENAHPPGGRSATEKGKDDGKKESEFKVVDGEDLDEERFFHGGPLVQLTLKKC